jgi:microcystin-dependent protein
MIIKFKRTYSLSKISGSEITKSELVILTSQKPARSQTVRANTSKAKTTRTRPAKTIRAKKKKSKSVK